jgi:hypothetical protein
MQVLERDALVPRASRENVGKQWGGHMIAL